MPEMSLSAFIGHIGAMGTAVREAEAKGLEKAAKIIEAEAKGEIGTYQEEAAPFAAWAELADSTKEDRLKQGYTENDPGLRSGEMRDSIGHQVGEREAVVGSNDDKLVWFELGTSKQPPRSVLGAAAIRKGEVAAKAVGGDVVKALIGERVVDGRLDLP